ncbi:MAG TPA: M91 family zinc metallopeptidase [Thermoanaerobaculia bacterium]|nr:M91 family zinc metallopeptidase [Thermoanaerobaculia bacterium]
MGQPAARILDPTVHGGIVSVGAPTTIIGSMPAARLGDMHVCPQVTVLVPHVGGPIVFGALNVLVGGVPAARVMDPCICVGPPDMIEEGEMTALIGMEGAFAGGLGGFLALLLGGALAGVKNFVSPYPSAVADTDDPNKYYTQYSKGVQVRGTPEFQARTMENLQTIESTNTGSATLGQIDDSGKTVSIYETSSGNETNNFSKDAWRKSVGGKNGAGSNSDVHFNPDLETLGDDADWQTRPPDVGLLHELRHSSDAAQGGLDPGSRDIDGRKTLNAEAQAVGLGPYSGDSNTENTYRSDRGLIPRTYY